MAERVIGDFKYINYENQLGTINVYVTNERQRIGKNMHAYGARLCIHQGVLYIYGYNENGANDLVIVSNNFNIEIR